MLWNFSLETKMSWKRGWQDDISTSFPGLFFQTGSEVCSHVTLDFCFIWNMLLQTKLQTAVALFKNNLFHLIYCQPKGFLNCSLFFSPERTLMLHQEGKHCLLLQIQRVGQIFHQAELRPEGQPSSKLASQPVTNSSWKIHPPVSRLIRKYSSQSRRQLEGGLSNNKSFIKSVRHACTVTPSYSESNSQSDSQSIYHP